MDGKVTNPILPEAYKSRSFNEVKLKELYGTGPTASQQRKFNKYLQSEQGQLAKFNFDKEESNKVFAAAEARMKARTDFYQKQRNTERAAWEQQQKSEIQKDQPPVLPELVVKTVDLPEGEADRAAKLNQWESHMTTLGYTPIQLSNGTTAFKDANGGTYYSNGRLWSNGKGSTYDYKTLAKVQPNPIIPKNNASTALSRSSWVTNINGGYNTDAEARAQVDQLIGNNEYLRKHKNSIRVRRIGDKFYPLVVTTGLSVDNYHNDRSFLYDQSTNTYLPMIETWSGGSKEQNGAFTRADGKYLAYTWDDIKNGIVVKGGKYHKQGGIINKHKQGGTMNKIKYFQQGGKPTAQAGQQDMQQQVIALVQAAMQGDQKATQTVNKIMEAAKAGDKQAMQIAQLIQQVAQKMQGQATTAKWGAKLSYIRSLKYAHGGKTCPSCDKGTKVKVAYKDIDKETYKKLPTDKQHAASMHAEHYASEYNKNGTYKTVHKPTAEDSTTIDKKHLSVNMKKKYTDKKECGGKAKKRYFGGWL